MARASFCEMRRAYKIAAVALVLFGATRAEAAVPASDAIPIILTLLFLGALFGGFLLIIWGRYLRQLRKQREQHRREILHRTREARVSGKWAPTTIRETKLHDLERQRDRHDDKRA